MKVKGKIWRKKEDLDSAYKYFKMQVKSHHNSNSFKVKGLGKAALQNMEYLLERAKQDLEVYFIKKPTPRTIVVGGKKKQLHTFCLKGKDSNTPKTLLKNLCKTTEVQVNDRKLAFSIQNLFESYLKEKPQIQESQSFIDTTCSIKSSYIVSI